MNHQSHKFLPFADLSIILFSFDLEFLAYLKKFMNFNAFLKYYSLLLHFLKKFINDLKVYNVESYYQSKIDDKDRLYILHN